MCGHYLVRPFCYKLLHAMCGCKGGTTIILVFQYRLIHSIPADKTTTRNQQQELLLLCMCAHLLCIIYCKLLHVMCKGGTIILIWHWLVICWSTPGACACSFTYSCQTNNMKQQQELKLCEKYLLCNSCNLLQVNNMKIVTTNQTIWNNSKNYCLVYQGASSPGAWWLYSCQPAVW